MISYLYNFKSRPSHNLSRRFLHIAPPAAFKIQTTLRRLSLVFQVKEIVPCMLCKTVFLLTVTLSWWRDILVVCKAGLGTLLFRVDGTPTYQMYCVASPKFSDRTLPWLLSVNLIHKTTKIVLEHDDTATTWNGMGKNFTCHELWSDMTVEKLKISRYTLFV